MKDKPMITRNVRPFPERLDGRKVITQPFQDIHKGVSDLENPMAEEYLAGLNKSAAFWSVPDTIEDELPPVSQAFADKVRAMGGIMTPYGIICDPEAPVTGKRYMRLAKVYFRLTHPRLDRHVEDTEFRIRNYGKRDKKAPDWMGMNAHFIQGLRLAIKHRHRPGERKPTYISAVTMPSSGLIMLEKADFPVEPPFKE